MGNFRWQRYFATVRLFFFCLFDGSLAPDRKEKNKQPIDRRINKKNDTSQTKSANKHYWDGDTINLLYSKYTATDCIPYANVMCIVSYCSIMNHVETFTDWLLDKMHISQQNDSFVIILLIFCFEAIPFHYTSQHMPNMNHSIIQIIKPQAPNIWHIFVKSTESFFSCDVCVCICFIVIWGFLYHSVSFVFCISFFCIHMDSFTFYT